MADHWLVRTKENLIAGPYTGDQIKELVLTGKLGYQDEICKANHYWIYVHERQEVKNLLGIDVPKPSKDPDEEVTETETQTETILEMESSLEGGEDVTRVGTLLARKKPGTPAAAPATDAPPLELEGSATSKQRPIAAARAESPVPSVTPGVVNGNGGAARSAAEKEPASRQKLVILVAAGVAAALFLLRYLTS